LTFFGFRFETWHAPWGYPRLQAWIEFALPPGPEVGVARRFCAISALELETFLFFALSGRTSQKVSIEYT
jgi:hypothetical protein